MKEKIIEIQGIKLNDAAIEVLQSFQDCDHPEAGIGAAIDFILQSADSFVEKQKEKVIDILADLSHLKQSIKCLNVKGGAQ